MEPIDVLTRVPSQPDRYVSQLLHASPHMRVVLFALQTGQEVKAHTSPSEVLMHVVKGRGTILSGDAQYPVAQGAVVICRSLEPHGFRAEEEMIILAVIAPAPGAGIKGQGSGIRLNV